MLLSNCEQILLFLLKNGVVCTVVNSFVERELMALREETMTQGKKIAAVVTCMDCRLHRPDAEQYRQLCEVLGVDDCYVETEAGPDGAVLNDTERCCAAVRNLVIIKEAKQPDVMAIVAHYDCAGHPVTNEEHDRDVVAAAEKLSQEIFGESGKVVPLVAYPSDAEEGPTWLLKHMDEVRQDVAAE